MARTRHITVVGAGVTGLWQACELAYRGHCVELVERSATPFTNAASQYAGAMLAPYCEREGADAIVQELGLEGLERWKRLCPAVVGNGTLVVALPRDRSDLKCFAARTGGHRHVDAAGLADLEPDLAGRFREGLHFPDEAHVEPASALAFLLERAHGLGVRTRFGTTGLSAGADLIVDCRGFAARDKLPSLRGVRGERAVVQTSEITLHRAIRLLHPRLSLYVVPWGSGTYMLGATVIENEDAGPVTLRSILDLLGLAFALHPAFGEARVLSLDSGIRPAFPDNLPKIVVGDGRILVNGLYRHGFLLSPVLASMVADHLEEKRIDSRLLVEGATEITPAAAQSAP